MISHVQIWERGSSTIIVNKFSLVDCLIDLMKHFLHREYLSAKSL